MTHERIDANDPTIAAALADLQSVIVAQYPDAHFDVFEGEDPDGVYLRVTVDIDDSSDALVPALDTLHRLEVEQGLPIYVVTDQPLERVAAQLKARPIEPRPTLFHLQ